MTLASAIEELQARTGVEDVLIARGAVKEVPGLVGEAEAVALLVDENEFVDASGARVKEELLAALRGMTTVKKVTLAGTVHADEKTVAEAVAGCEGTDVVVTLGSGTICDIGKVAAMSNEARHVVVQSAASVNGYSDDMSVLLLKGVKRTTRTAWPTALVIDVDILTAAPTDLNGAGVGDMTSIFTAAADWYLSSLFDLDRGYDSEVAMMIRRHGDRLLDIAPGVGGAEPDATKTLAEFLTLSGFAMGVVGQTSPQSGMEHLISHMLDMAKGARGEETAFHGAQVGVAAALACIVWRRMRERIEKGEVVSFVTLDEAEARRRIADAFGWMDENAAAAEECWRDYSAKLSVLAGLDGAARLGALSAEWDRHAAVLDGMLVSPELIIGALKDSGAAVTFSALNEPATRADVVWALKNCHFMRNRFTIVDFAFATGFWTDEEIESVLDEAAALGAGL